MQAMNDEENLCIMRGVMIIHNHHCRRRHHCRHWGHRHHP